ncbi:MAG: polysaccharide biosynthesis protein [Oscillospiraceae bacterium]|nr:polysaccharide biosynthesis protein [Oscillospiraceae bacterium]
MAKHNKAQKQSFIHGAAVLAAAVIITKVIGAVFKIPLVNIIGNVGYGQFTVAYNIYSLLITISTGGLPVALSKMIAEAESLGRRNQVKKIARIATTTLTVLGLIFTLFMLICCKWLADKMGNFAAWHAILALAPSVLFVCLMSSYRGYFQGHSNMTPTAVSQVIEALCKLCVGLGLAWLALQWDKGVEIAAAGAIVGVTVGSVLGALYIVIYRRRHRNDYDDRAATDVPDESVVIFKRFMKLAIPITLSSSIMSIVSLIDNAIVLNRLQNVFGYTEEYASGLFGNYGSAQTLFNLPVTLITPITASVVPNISENVARGNHLQARKLSETGLRLAALISLPCAFGLFVLAHPIMDLLYHSQAEVVSVGWPLLRILAPAVIANSVLLVTNSILQSYGFVKIPIISMICGGVVKIIANYVLVAVPSLGIKGAPIGTLACFVVIAVINIVAIKIKIPESPSIPGTFVRPLISSVVMGAGAWGVYTVIIRLMGYNGLNNALGVLVGIVAAVIIYVVMVVITGAIRKEDVIYVPKGEKIAKILHLR